MANLKNVIYLSNEDYETLVSTGTVTIDGETLTYDENNVYVTPDKLASTTEDGLMSAADKSKLDTIESGAEANVNADWNAASGDAQILNKPTLGTAAAKNFTTSVTSGSNDLVTSGAVYTAIDNLPEPMIYKGTLGTGGTITALPTASSENEGFTYKVITAGTYASQAAKVGDVFISNGSDWVLIPSGDDIEDTWRQINVNGTQLLGTGISTGAVNFKNGNNVTITGSGNDITIASSYTDTNQTVKGNGTAFGSNDAIDIVGAGTVTVTADTTNKKITITGSAHPTDHNQTVKGNGTTFGADAAVDIVGGGATTVTADTTNNKITISTPSVTDTNQKVKAGSVTFDDNDVVNFEGSGIVSVTGNATNDKITISASHQSIKTLKTDNTTAQSTSSSETISGSGTINLHKVSKTGDFPDLLRRTSNFIDEPGNYYNTPTLTFRPFIYDTAGNRMYGINYKRVIVEESVDAGQTWTVRSLTEVQKNQLFDNSNGGGQAFPKVNGQHSCSAMLRVTCSAANFGSAADDAADANKLALWTSENYVSNTFYCNCDRYYVYVGGPNYCDCWVQTAPAPSSGASPVFTNQLKIDLARGWNGGNTASTTSAFVLGGSKTQAPIIRFVFRVNSSDGQYDDSKLSQSSSNLNIMSIRLLGNTIWGSANSMMQFNTPYKEASGYPFLFDWYGSLKPNSNATYNLGASSHKWNQIHGVTIYENGTSLADKYLGKSAKAADADKLDGHDSSYFATAGSVPTTYLASASASGNTLTITPSSGTAITYTPSFTESDTLDSVTGRGATTNTQVALNGGFTLKSDHSTVTTIAGGTSGAQYEGLYADRNIISAGDLIALNSSNYAKVKYDKINWGVSGGGGYSYDLSYPKLSGTLALTSLIAPEYSASSTYAIGQKVVHDGQLYKCSTRISTAEAWNSAHWTAIKVSSSFVDLDTAQTITGAKTFNSGITTNEIQNDGAIILTNINNGSVSLNYESDVGDTYHNEGIHFDINVDASFNLVGYGTQENQTYYLPENSGTLATTDDIPQNISDGPDGTAIVAGEGIFGSVELTPASGSVPYSYSYVLTGITVAQYDAIFNALGAGGTASVKQTGYSPTTPTVMTWTRTTQTMSPTGGGSDVSVDIIDTGIGGPSFKLYKYNNQMYVYSYSSIYSLTVYWDDTDSKVRDNLMYSPNTVATINQLKALNEEITDDISTAVAPKADDSAVVHKSGDETIAGVKTFGSSYTYGGGLKFTAATAGSAGTLTGLFNASAASYPEISNIKQIVFYQGSGATHSADTYATTLVSSSAPAANITLTLPNKTGTLATTKYEHNIILTLSQGNGTTGKLCCSFRFIDDNSSAYTTHANLVTAMFNAGYNSSSHYITANGEYTIPGSTYQSGYKYTVVGLYYTSASDTYPGIKAILTGTYSGGNWTINDTTSSYSSISVYGNTTPTIVDNVREL